MEQITKTSDVYAKKNVINRISDIPGGISLLLSTLIAGNIIPEATPVSAPSSGKRTICKQARVLTGSSTTVKKVTTGEHNFKVGDFLCTKEGGKAYAITSITTSNGVDDITVGTAIEATAADEWIYEATAEAASNTSAFKNIPDAILAEAFIVPASGAVVMQTGRGLLHAAVAQYAIGPLYLAYLKGIVEVKY